MIIRSAVEKLYMEKADIQQDRPDLWCQGFVEGIRFAMKFTEQHKEDRFGKLHKFQISDDLSALIKDES